VRDVEAASATALASPHGLQRAHTGQAPEDVGLFRPAIGLACLAVVVSLFVFESRLRAFEASISVHLVHLLGLHDTVRMGSTVLFRTDGVLTGYTLTLGCTAAFLVVPFFVATGALVAIHRVPAIRSVTSLIAAVATVLVFNQIRLLTIALAMNAFGARRGYSYSHVLVGTFISTIGVVCAGFIYLAILLRGSFYDVRSPE
jgi:exosortase/archaeosortase family protein